MKEQLFDTSSLVETLIGHAKTHGEDSEPDHEVGDLQDMLRAAWSLMTPEQHRQMLCHPDVSNVVESATFEPLLTSIDDLTEEEWQDACEHFGLDTSFQYTDAQQMDIVNHYRLEPVGEAQEEGEAGQQAIVGGER